MSSIDIVEGWDFKDEELLTVLGKKATKDADELYADLLDTVRKNPINQHPIPKGYNEYIRPILMGKLWTKVDTISIKQQAWITFDINFIKNKP